MKQLTQKLGDGAMDILEVATPSLGRGMVLVQNHFSLISAGTEGSTVTAARKSLIGKAKARPQQVKQVLDSLKSIGPVQTYRAVKKKLDSYSPLGYSSSGVVVEVASGVKGLVVGDYVACAGAGYANHAEVIAVPANLCVRLPQSANLCDAAYNTLGAIALQGVRQADLRVGETCVVIGLGLLGQLTALILRASGVNVIGLDINPKAIETGLNHCLDAGFEMGDAGLDGKVHQYTGGIGADAVIITAATQSSEPINIAGALLRKRGTVVVVGDVPTGFQREPDYYKKELSLKMSCSYGPGRYDISYEEKGMDYPAGYVRWTENRNMQAFQNLIHSGKIHIDHLTTHRFSIDDAPDAYDLIMNQNEDYLGLIIAYDTAKQVTREKVLITGPGRASTPAGTPGFGFIGAGSYAMSYLLPNLPKDGKVAFTGVLTSSGTSSRSVAEKYGFSFAASSPGDILENKDTTTVFIATRHNTHAQYTLDAIEAGKHVFVEKPLCLTGDELNLITTAWQKKKPVVMVGFNRRFAPLARKLKETLGSGTMSMMYRINAGHIPENTWIQDTEIGGGRILGEVCHFVDLMIYMNGSLPVRVHASAMNDPSHMNDTVNINLTFENGSIGSINYFANGSKSLRKEYFEVYQSGVTGIVDDFKELVIHGSGKPSRKKLINQDKGQKNMMADFVQAMIKGGNCPIPFEETHACTLTTLKILESLRSGQAVAIEGLS